MILSGNTLSIILIVIVSILSTILILGLLISYIYKRRKGLPTGDCAYCHVNKDKIIKQYHKKYAKK